VFREPPCFLVVALSPCSPRHARSQELIDAMGPSRFEQAKAALKSRGWDGDYEVGGESVDSLSEVLAVRGAPHVPVLPQPSLSWFLRLRVCVDVYCARGGACGMRAPRQPYEMAFADKIYALLQMESML
jgi:hypothetical protein